jgi:hypothetical protein
MLPNVTPETVGFSKAYLDAASIACKRVRRMMTPTSSTPMLHLHHSTDQGSPTTQKCPSEDRIVDAPRLPDVFPDDNEDEILQQPAAGWNLMPLFNSLSRAQSIEAGRRAETTLDAPPSAPAPSFPEEEEPMSPVRAVLHSRPSLPYFPQIDEEQEEPNPINQLTMRPSKDPLTFDSFFRVVG